MIENDFCSSDRVKEVTAHAEANGLVSLRWWCYCSENLVKADECVHELKQEFTAMTEHN